jgi:uncharacterized integral membrane protein
MNAKIIGIIVLLALLGIFAVQNAQPVTIKFLFWDGTTSAVLIILVSFLIGVLVGCLVLWVVSKKNKKKATPNPP